METGDGRTEDSGGLTRNEENVIRLPRDWLGPPEELVPIGPAARARAAQRELEHGMPPAADAFWSEDAAALHDAVQAPPEASRQRQEPPVGLVPPIAGAQLPGLDRLPRLRPRTGGVRLLRWLSLAIIPIVALVLIALLGSTRGPAPHPAASAASASRGATSSGSTPSSAPASSDAAAEKFQAQVAHRRELAAARVHARTRTRGTRQPKTRPVKVHHRATTHHSTASPAPTVTEAAAAPVTSHPSAPVTTSTPAASTASTASSAGSKPATGPPGPIGIGSISDGCTVKCS